MFKKSYLEKIKNDYQFQNFLKYTSPKTQEERDNEMREMFLSGQEEVKPFDEMKRTARDYKKMLGLVDLDVDRFRDEVILDKINYL